MDSSLHLGDSAIDAEHERFESFVAILAAAASPAQALAALERLSAHAVTHFAGEDADLREMKDGNASCHIDEHANVLKSLAEVRDVLSDGNVAQASRVMLSQRLAHELRVWLPEHVSEMDSAVVAHRAKRRFGGAPVKIARSAKSGAVA